MQRILEAFGEIDERYWTSAMSCERCRRRKWIARSVAVAACLCLLCMVGVYFWNTLNISPSDGIQPSYCLGETVERYGRSLTSVAADQANATVTVMVRNASSKDWMVDVSFMGNSYASTGYGHLYSKDENGNYYIDVYINGQFVSHESHFFGMDNLNRELLVIPADGNEYEITFDFSRYKEKNGTNIWWYFGGYQMVYTERNEK